MHIGAAETPPLQADDVEPVEHGALTDGKGKRDHVAGYAAHARHHGALADAHVLVDGSVAAERHIIAGGDVTAEYGAVGQRDVIADMAVVPDMRAGEEEAARADLGEATAILGAGIHRHAFANIAIRTNDEPGRPAAILYGLRRRPQRHKRCDLRARADAGMARQVHMGLQVAAILDHHVRADDAIRADVHVVRDFSAAIDHGSRMDARHHAYSSAIIAPSSASATNWPPTLASPRNHHIMRRLDILLM